jgi:aryl-alcohol dehydrogenase-like predicted oxidoreductase
VRTTLHSALGLGITFWDTANVYGHGSSEEIVGHAIKEYTRREDQYNLIMREEEREMFPLLDLQGVDSIPWSPLAGGRVARPWGDATTSRGSQNPDTDFHGRPLFLDRIVWAGARTHRRPRRPVARHHRRRVGKRQREGAC